MPSRRHVLRTGGAPLAGLAWPRRPLASEPAEIRMQGDTDGSHVWFDPMGLRIEPGRTIRWINLDPGNSHTATSYHPKFERPLRMREGSEPWNSDHLLPNDSFSVTLTVEGVYDLKDIDAINDQGEARVIYLPSACQDSDPEAAAARAEVRRLLERAVDQLPESFRMVFVLREIEEMSSEETAAHLGLRPETVKTRLHRARRLLRQPLAKTLSSAVSDVFPCAGTRCARITDAVLERINLSGRTEE